MIHLLRVWKICCLSCQDSFHGKDLYCTVFCPTVISEKLVCHHTKERTIYFVLFLFDGGFIDRLGSL